MNQIAPYAKAIIGALIAGLASLQQALDNSIVTAQEWTGVAIALLSGLALVWAIPNRDPQAEHQAESVQPPHAGERGESALGIALTVLVVVVLVVVLLRLL